MGSKQTIKSDAICFRYIFPTKALRNAFELFLLVVSLLSEKNSGMVAQRQRRCFKFELQIGLIRSCCWRPEGKVDDQLLKLHYKWIIRMISFLKYQKLHYQRQLPAT